jgi:hypothetical protein
MSGRLRRLRARASSRHDHAAVRRLHELVCKRRTLGQERRAGRRRPPLARVGLRIREHRPRPVRRRIAAASVLHDDGARPLTKQRRVPHRGRGRRHRRARARLLRHRRRRGTDLRVRAPDLAPRGHRAHRFGRGPHARWSRLRVVVSDTAAPGSVRSAPSRRRHAARSST